MNIIMIPSVSLTPNVLKLARHGSNSANTTGFLDTVNPSIAVISVAKNSDFLSKEVLNRLDAQGANVFRTDLHGNIVITSDGVKLSVEIEKEPKK